MGEYHWDHAVPPRGWFEPQGLGGELCVSEADCDDDKWVTMKMRGG